jgi:hypothetical protein
MVPIITLIALALGAVPFFARPAYPAKIYTVLCFMVFAATPLVTFAHIPLYPPPGSASPWAVAAVLLGLAVTAPIVGVGESMWSRQEVVFSNNRFLGHLRTNLFGALAASALWWVADSASGLAGPLATFPSSDIVLNVMLPVSAGAVLQFVRWQQMDALGKVDDRTIDEVMRKDPKEGEGKIVGFSLRHWHQLANIAHLVAATFVASCSFLFLVAYAMKQTAGEHPVLTWPVVAAILLTLSFLYACGARGSRENKAVYLTFLTGTPAALGGAMLWLAWFRNGTFRDGAMALIGVVGYVLYCVEAVLADWARDEKEGRPPLHYFAPMTIAVVIAVLLGIAYFARA